MRNEHDLCKVAGPGEGESCECVEKKIVIGYDYECEINWDVSHMVWCATNTGFCAAVCLITMDTWACSECLVGAGAECCGMGDCELCDFIEECEEDDSGYPVEKWVFDYFDGDSCSN